MTYEEYQHRLQMVNKAKAMFPEENNISIAFEKYMATLPESERLPLVISSKETSRPVTVMDDYERIPCAECGMAMMFRILPENKEGYHTQIVCPNDDCDNVLNSEYTLQDWMAALRKI